MIKVISKILLLLILLTILVNTKILAYSDDLFKFDLPDNYEKSTYKDMYVFSDNQNENRGIVIHTYQDKGLKKSVWEIEKSDLDKIVRYLGVGTNIVETNKKAKLGKEKAVRVLLKDDEIYVEVYILASNKYIYIVSFVSSTQSDLNNEDYEAIKKSFKLKDRTTNPTAVYILVIVVILGIRGFISYKKQKNKYSPKYSENEIDYKNMTEEDFNKMD